MADWQPIETAPRDGTVIWLSWLDDGHYVDRVRMAWDAKASNAIFSLPGTVGIWMCPKGSMTWDESRGCGPTHWKLVPH